jgi:hypothetical protein
MLYQKYVVFYNNIYNIYYTHERESVRAAPAAVQGSLNPNVCDLRAYL